MRLNGAKSRGYISLGDTHELRNFLSRLRPGQVLHGRVVKALGANVALVEFAGRRLRAQSSVGLIEGELIAAKIKELSRPIVMQLIEEGRESPDLHLGWDKLRELMSRLRITPGAGSIGTLNYLIKGLEDLKVTALKLESWEEGATTSPVKPSQKGELIRKLVRMTPFSINTFRSW